ncbi:MAG: hypothetical protein ACI9DK_003011 [Vicingaceae bacterium]|jgi:hypothetical protein
MTELTTKKNKAVELIRSNLAWVIGIFIINAFFQSIYAIQVCPYVEKLPVSEVIGANLIIAFVLILVRHFTINTYFKSSSHNITSRKLIILDTVFILSGGVSWGIYNSLFHQFPIESAIKVLTGFASTGVLTGLLLFTIRQVNLFQTEKQETEVRSEKYAPISKDLLIFAVTIIILVLINGIFLIIKDLRWMITLEESQFMWATKSIIMEVVFVALAYSFYIVLIASFYSRYLKLQLHNQTNVLDAVSKGILTDTAKTFGNDEFTIVAQHTNKMIQQLQEHSEISQSIVYTKNLQDALLPSEVVLKKSFSDLFILFKPRDVVSGDFYWTEKVGDIVLLAVADSTGHGVPGAMVSIVCINALNRSVREHQLTSPEKILSKTRELIGESFKCGETIVRDGMDISLLALNVKTLSIEWSGAYNPLWIIADRPIPLAHSQTSFSKSNTLNILNADRQSVGYCEKNLAFTKHHLQLKKGDQIYLFTDGYADQFGGDKGKKLKAKKLKEIIASIHNLNKKEQYEHLEMIYADWKGNLEQVDDICIIGLTL